jgi:putative endonuclease
LAKSFTKRHGIKMLVYFEAHGTIASALQREKNIKHRSREWKIDLINAGSPD